MPEWSNTWEYPDKKNPEVMLTFIKCMACKKSMLVQYKDNHKCPAEQPEPPKPSNEYRDQKKMTAFKPMVADDVELFVSIKETLEKKLGRELKGEEHGWVSTIYIQRKRM